MRILRVEDEPHQPKIDRRDWGLEWNQALETGGVLVGHNVKVQAEAKAVRQEATGKVVA